jgi:hypothetical protein
MKTKTSTAITKNSFSKLCKKCKLRFILDTQTYCHRCLKKAHHFVDDNHTHQHESSTDEQEKSTNG